MIKKFIAFLFIFSMLSSFSYAANDDAKWTARLQKDYGRDLTKAPYFLRFSFEKSFNKTWKESFFYERRIFLENYETELARDQAL